MAGLPEARGPFSLSCRSPTAHSSADPELVAAYLAHRVLLGQVDDGQRTVDLVPRAVRTRVHLAVTDERGGTTMSAHGVDYLVSVPGTVQLLTLAFVTPYVDVLDPLVRLFATIDGAFYRQWDGDDGLPGLFDP
ncbi:MAG: hypothetical protein ACJ73S_18930 [Mycobacteriales bacterium]